MVAPLLPDDPSLISRWMGAIATFFAACVGVLLAGWKMQSSKNDGLDKKISENVKALHAKVETKADAQRVEQIAANLAQAFAQQREDKQQLVTTMNQDKQQIMSAIGHLSDQIGRQHSDILVELGKRPTREELRQ